ncbi:MAG: glycosyltransferase [Deltaproteobacteria bacterium]|nr:glycosyltransferase [Deltaproteobacteria bacterium]
MKKNIDAVFFVPFCEKEYDMVIDTIASIRHYVKEPHHIIAVDDFSPSRLDERLKAEVPGITVLRNPRRHGGRSGLYITQAIACKHALEHFNFKMFIKMDTDALMVGPGLVTRAATELAERPATGILGSWEFRADGKKRNWHMWRLTFLTESSPARRLFSKPVLWRKPIREAKKHGYRLGENILGGCYILNERCLRAMARMGYLDYEYDNILRFSKIGDEIIFSLFCKAAGFEIHDFGRPADPMVIALDIVPMAKEKLMAEGKAVIHSVKKGFDGETQAQMREFFKAHRV